MKTLELDHYQAEALRTSGNLKRFDNESMAICALGIAGEAGEVADMIKKVVGHGHALDVPKLLKEIGDVLWYAALLSELVDAKLSQVAQLNIDKLRARYPDGFTQEASKNRKDETK